MWPLFNRIDWPSIAAFQYWRSFGFLTFLFISKDKSTQTLQDLFRNFLVPMNISELIYKGVLILESVCLCKFILIFRRPSQLRWGASNSLIVGEEGEEEKLAFWAWMPQGFWVLCHLFDSFGLFLNLLKFLESFGIFWNLLECFGMFQNFLEFFGIFWNFLESFGMFWNVLEFFGNFGIFFGVF